MFFRDPLDPTNDVKAAKIFLKIGGKVQNYVYAFF